MVANKRGKWERRGATMMEYGLIGALIAVAILPAVEALGANSIGCIMMDISCVIGKEAESLEACETLNDINYPELCWPDDEED
jgi:hypothetical protein